MAKEVDANHVAVVMFIYERDTKNKIRFEEVASENNTDPFVPKIGTLYVSKSAFKNGVPKGLRVHIDTTPAG